MALVTWIGGSTGGGANGATTWSRAQNWLFGTVPNPLGGDDVTVAPVGPDQLVLNVSASIGTLQINDGASLTVNGARTLNVTDVTNPLEGITLFGTGKIVLSNANATVSSAGGILLDPASVITGFGTLTGTLIASTTGGGTVLASGGSLHLTSAVSPSSGVTFEVDNTASSILRFDGSVGATNTVSFFGTLGAIELNDVSISPTTSTGNLNFAGTVTGMDVATSATLKPASTDYINVQAPITSVLFDGTHIELFSNGIDLGAITLGTAVDPNTTHVDWVSDISLTNSKIGSGTDIFLSSVVCFAAGTRILTQAGERTVESLLEGDIVLTVAAGDQLSAQPVKWIGRRRIDLTAHPRPETVAPVRIRRDAFADNVPQNDLSVSPDHAIFVDGKLICARQLINGTTIVQQNDCTSVEYFHVELDTHAILLAEGLPAESYLNTGNQGFFANSGEPLVLHPDLTDETDYPTREAASCAPFVWDEGNVRPVWQRVAERAAALGQPVPQLDTTTDPDLHIIAKGRTVRPLYGSNGLYVFALPRGATQARLVSRAGSPTGVRPWLEDRRCLGVYVERIVLRNVKEEREIAVDHPGLSRGWWAVEKSGIAIRRWTNGDALLPLPAFSGPAMLEIHLSGETTYAVEADARSETGIGSMVA
jgi:hypothetical protein